jgi:glucose-1-phosphate thymidylyltransferase
MKIIFSDINKVNAMCAVGLIPAAGIGKRLKPITEKIPKPLVRVKGRALIEYAIEHLKAMGVKKIVVALSYKKEMIEEFIKSKNFNIEIEFCYPDALYGLAYTVYSARDLINETFVVHLADNIYTKNCKYALDFHIKEHANATLIVEEGSPNGRYEAIRLVGNRIVDIIEKAKVSYGYRGTGIYIFEPEIFNYCKKVKVSERGELELQDAIKMMIDDGKKVVGVPLIGRRFEITTAEDLNIVEKELGRVDYL